MKSSRRSGASAAKRAARIARGVPSDSQGMNEVFASIGSERSDAGEGRRAELEAFAAEVVACRACEVAGYLTRAHPIRPTLTEDPRLMLIGQGAGAVTGREGGH